MARKPGTLYADELKVYETAIAVLRGGAASAVIYGTTYGPSDLASLRRAHELLSVKAAIQAIEEGGQAYQTSEGFTYTRADLEQLYTRRDTLERRASARGRGGLRVRQVVPEG